MEVVNNTDNLQFEIALGKELAYLVYRTNEGKMYFMHTKVPEAMQGKGIASKLIRKAFRYASQEGFEVVLYCPFSKRFLEKHHEYQHLVKN